MEAALGVCPRSADETSSCCRALGAAPFSALIALFKHAAVEDPAWGSISDAQRCDKVFARCDRFLLRAITDGCLRWRRRLAAVVVPTTEAPLNLDDTESGYTLLETYEATAGGAFAVLRCGRTVVERIPLCCLREQDEEF